MPSAYNLPQLYQDEIDALIKAGYYSNKSEVVRDALRSFFEAKQHMRMAAAVELYREGKTTLSKAAEIAIVSIEEFTKILIDRGIRISKKEVLKGIQKLNSNKI